MDLRKIKKLIELVEESGIAELEVHSGDESVRIARPAALPASAPLPASAALPASAPPAVMPSTEPAPQKSESGPVAAAIPVRAPMAGTFYVAAEPGGPAFAPVGADLAADAVVGIIESMKMMNELRAPEAGQCIEVLVRDGEPVSAGQVLLRLVPGRS